MCTKCCDAWGNEVQGRLQQCIDFVAAEAVYYQKCNVMFRFGKCKPPASMFPFRQQRIQRKGVPTDVLKQESFQMMCEWLEGNKDGELVTVAELREQIAAMVGESAVYKTRIMKEQLKAKYGDHVLFTSSRGRTDVVCLRDMASFILHEKWQSDRQMSTMKASGWCLQLLT